MQGVRRMCIRSLLLLIFQIYLRSLDLYEHGVGRTRPEGEIDSAVSNWAFGCDL